MTPASTRWDGIVGWVWTRPTPLKRAHLRQHPFVSCTYWDPQPDLAVAECDARWEVDPTERERVWNLVAVPALPLGWDPVTIFPGGPADQKAGLLRLDPWRLSWYRPRTWPPVGGPRCGSLPESTRRTSRNRDK